MMRVGADDRGIIFQISTREHAALLQVLQVYPVVPPAHHAVTKALDDPHIAEYQRLLDEALAEQRAANQRHLRAWLDAPDRFQKTKSGRRFRLERADSEWLLQVLNDIRVGNWLLLGSPEPGALQPQNIEARCLPAWFAMEMSGYFQMSLLEALGN